jgi:hypothetical protein
MPTITVAHTVVREAVHPRMDARCACCLQIALAWGIDRINLGGRDEDPWFYGWTGALYLGGWGVDRAAGALQVRWSEADGG